MPALETEPISADSIEEWCMVNAKVRRTADNLPTGEIQRTLETGATWVGGSAQDRWVGVCRLQAVLLVCLFVQKHRMCGAVRSVCRQPQPNEEEGRGHGRRGQGANRSSLQL